MTIKVEGVSKQQQQILNIMWNINTTQDLNQWMNTLTTAMRNEAEVLEQMLMISIIDAEVDKHQDQLGLAQSMLANIMR